MPSHQGEAASVCCLGEALALPECLRLSLEGCVARILEQAEDEDLVKRVQLFFDRYRHAIADLENCTAIDRLRGIHAFGLKNDPRTALWLIFLESQIGIRPVQIASAPFRHDRWTHSVFVAAHAIVLALRLGWSFERVIIAAMAALLHDVGYGMFSHDGDDFLVAMGRESHEARGQRLVLEDLDIRESLALAGVEPAKVVRAMREEGQVGLLLKIADTLGYIVLDTEMVGEPVGYGFARRVIQSITAIDENGSIHASDSAPLQELLEHRARMFRDVYYHPQNMMAASALHLVLDYLVQRKVVTLEDIECQTDSWMEMRLSFWMNDSCNDVPPWILSAWSLAHGIDETGEWDFRSFATKTEIVSWIVELPIKALGRIFIVSACDYTAKQYAVTLPDGRCQTLRAPSSWLHAFATRWHVFSYSGTRT